MLKRISRALTLVAIASAGLARPVSGQACASATDPVAVHLRVQVRKIAGSSEAEYAYARRDYRLPSVDSSTVVAVTQSQTCQKLLAAYSAAVPGLSPAPTRIYAVRVGTSYVTLYPTADTHTWPMVVLDSKYKVLSKFAM